MRNHSSSALAVALILLVAPAVASDPSDEKKPPEKKAGLESMLGLLGSPAMPSLQGLISPENMGMLTDNLSRIKDIFSANRENEANALSGNETKLKMLADNEPELLSKNHVPIIAGNKTKMKAEIASGNNVLSGNRLFSGIKIEIHLHVNNPEDAEKLLEGAGIPGKRHQNRRAPR